MSRNFTNCLTMGAKYLKVVKRGSHPNNGWSPDEIRLPLELLELMVLQHLSLNDFWEYTFAIVQWKALTNWLRLAFCGIAKLTLWKMQPQTWYHIPKKQ
ncbi:hypothetical protein GmHk_12G035151 [Glycine max]|nr:hypothetical protein GmHk_12G035151 [Glycine max]